LSAWSPEPLVVYPVRSRLRPQRRWERGGRR